MPRRLSFAIAIWEDDFRATYGYFMPGQEPELDLSNDMTEMQYTAWNGMGRSRPSSVTYHSADHAYGYEVWYAGEDWRHQRAERR